MRDACVPFQAFTLLGQSSDLLELPNSRGQRASMRGKGDTKTVPWTVWSTNSRVQHKRSPVERGAR